MQTQSQGTVELANRAIQIEKLPVRHDTRSNVQEATTLDARARSLASAIWGSALCREQAAVRHAAPLKLRVGIFFLPEQS